MTSRVDMHCHSTASQLSRLGVQRSLGLPECATPPQEVYELAKRRGMDFVTITDHDTIDGCLEIADRPDTFISEELTARFAGEPQAVHVLCYGITPGDPYVAAGQRPRSRGLRRPPCRARSSPRLPTRSTTSPLRSPPATAGGWPRSSLIWRCATGPWRRSERRRRSTSIRTAVPGSADPTITPAWTSVAPSPRCRPPPRRKSFAAGRAGEARAGGEQGGSAKWAHAAVALATRALDPRPGRPPRGIGRSGDGDGDRAADGRPGRRARGRRERRPRARGRAALLGSWLRRSGSGSGGGDCSTRCRARASPRRPLPPRPPRPRPPPARGGRRGAMRSREAPPGRRR